MTALQKLRAQIGESGAPDQVEQQRTAPVVRPSRRWSMRIHWGIVFAVVASLVLWFAIKSVIGLLF